MNNNMTLMISNISSSIYIIIITIIIRIIHNLIIIIISSIGVMSIICSIFQGRIRLLKSLEALQEHRAASCLSLMHQTSIFRPIG